MIVTIFGGKGNMGKRYHSILKQYFPHTEVRIFDKEEFSKLNEEDIEKKFIFKVDKFIIATPTNLHRQYLKMLTPHGKPILCEKPLVMDKSIENMFLDTTYMVNNYFYLSPTEHDNDLTYYNYYHSGSDGLIWDCIQLIAYAKGRIHLSNNSLEWKCSINGKVISKDLIDGSYISTLKDFMCGNKTNFINANDLKILHKKVSKMHEDFIKSGQSEFWCSSKDY